jgi:hypothetical protein
MVANFKGWNSNITQGILWMFGWSNQTENSILPELTEFCSTFSLQMLMGRTFRGDIEQEIRWSRNYLNLMKLEK